MDLKCRWFNGSRPPTRRADFSTESYAFLPAAANYPDIDIMIWDQPTQTFYAIQITVGSLKAHSHAVAKIGSIGAHKNLWEARAMQWGAKRVTTKFVWVTPQPDVAIEHNGEYWTNFTSLDSAMFPILRLLK